MARVTRKDYDKFTYVPHPQARNILVGVPPAGEEALIDIEVPLVFDPFLFRVASKYPEYEFIHHTILHCNTVRLDEVCVFHNRKMLGEIARGNRGATPCIALTHSRITVRSGHTQKTGDLSKALALFDQYFTPETYAEQLRGEILRAHGELNTRVFRTSVALKGDYDAVAAGIKAFILHNPEEVAPILEKSGVVGEVVAAMYKAHEENRNVDFLNTALNEHRAVVVHGGENGYLVGAMDSLKDLSLGLWPCAPAPLPEELKRGVGMLKLVEPGQMLSGIGFRVTDNTFVVVPTGEEK
jgi:hypothetical protein